MIYLVKEVYSLLNPIQKRQFWILQLLVVTMAIFELLSIAIIFPFIAIVSDPALITENALIYDIYYSLSFQSQNNFLLFLAFCVLFFLTTASLVSVFTTWRLAMFASKVGIDVADRLFIHYLSQSWLFHARRSSSNLTKNIATESIRYSDFVIQPLMQINAKIVLSFLIAVSITIYNPIVALSAISIFLTVYLVLYFFVRVKLQENGEMLSKYNGERFNLMSQGFGGVKDVILLGTKSFFIEKFVKAGSVFANARGVNAGLSQVPRYMIELIAFGSIILLIIYLLFDNNNKIEAILPILSVYAFAGLKLLPAIQQVYVNLSQIKGNISAFDEIKSDLILASKSDKLASDDIDKKNHRMKIAESIKIDNVFFSYEQDRPVLNGINLEIESNQVVGIVGNSGSGKSTIIDIILGLISPQTGSLRVDGNVIDKNNVREWQNSIGFVPQSIFLTEGTISQNIAFGIPDELIDLEQVNKSLELAHLSELVNNMPKGLDTKVGERGIQLSGGQRQRIAIARALYFGADILVFDEATSALDGITEKMIMDAVHDFHGSKTIIMVAHRLKTVKQCDVIYFIDNGIVSDKGTYEELIQSNEKFRKMAHHS